MVLGDGLDIESEYLAKQESFEMMSEFENSQDCFSMGKVGQGGKSGG